MFKTNSRLRKDDSRRPMAAQIFADENLEDRRKKDVQRRRRAADNKNQVHVDVRRWYSNYNKL